MSKSNRIINLVSILFSKWIELRMINPHIKVGFFLIKTGASFLAGGLLVKIYFIDIANTVKRFIGIELSNSSSLMISILGIVLIAIGLFLCFKGLTFIRQSWSKKTFYYLKGLSNQTENPPSAALPKVAKWYPPNPVKLQLNTENSREMKKELTYHLKIISEKVEQTESDEIYFAGLARVPYLYFIGYGFRNAHSTITLLEHNHKTTKWFTLKDTDDIDLDLNIINEESVKPNDNRDVEIGRASCRERV